MNNTFGRNLTVTLVGESHGPMVGAVIDGMPSGVRIDEKEIMTLMDRRRPAGKTATARHESDIPQFLSGVKDGYSTGTPLTIMIPNENVRRSDYDRLADTPRPSHADYTGHIRYRGYEDASGGGHFSGRLTAALTAAGAICMHMLEQEGIHIATHILRLADIEDRPMDPLKDMDALKDKAFPVLSDEQGEKMLEKIRTAARENDSLGGILETAVTGLEAGTGDPFFDTVESLLAHALFAVPAVKGVSFGSGFGFADMKGSQANDPYAVKDGKIITLTNHNGGICGGITTGMPVCFQTVIRPTPSIGIPQSTVNLKTMENTQIRIGGRHDPAIVHRACPVIDAVTAIVFADLLIGRYGYEHFGGER